MSGLSRARRVRFRPRLRPAVLVLGAGGGLVLGGALALDASPADAQALPTHHEVSAFSPQATHAAHAGPSEAHPPVVERQAARESHAVTPPHPAVTAHPADTAHPAVAARPPVAAHPAVPPQRSPAPAVAHSRPAPVPTTSGREGVEAAGRVERGESRGHGSGSQGGGCTGQASNQQRGHGSGSHPGAGRSHEQGRPGSSEGSIGPDDQSGNGRSVEDFANGRRAGLVASQNRGPGRQGRGTGSHGKSSSSGELTGNGRIVSLPGNDNANGDGNGSTGNANGRGNGTGNFDANQGKSRAHTTHPASSTSSSGPGEKNQSTPSVSAPTTPAPVNLLLVASVPATVDNPPQSSFVLPLRSAAPVLPARPAPAGPAPTPGLEPAPVLPDIGRRFFSLPGNILHDGWANQSLKAATRQKFPIAFLAVAAVFFLIQTLVDRRDPKLSDAPEHQGEDSLEFE